MTTRLLVTSPPSPPSTAQPPTCDCTRQVEWQIATFWIICLALNSMTQPSGRVCEFPPRHRFFLRSSPVICAFDAVGVLALWVAHMFWHLESPTTAARRIARARFRDAENEDEEESVTSLEKNTPFRVVVFLLGALPQAIKLFASSGIPWLQAWGAMYLGSWVVLELLILLIRLYDHKHLDTTVGSSAHLSPANPLKWKRLRRVWAFLSICAHTLLLSISLRPDIGIAALPWVLFMIISSILSLIPLFADHDRQTSTFDATGSVDDVRILLLMVAVFVFCSSFVIFPSMDGSKDSTAALVFLVIFFGSVLLAIIYLCIVLLRIQLKNRAGSALTFFIALFLNLYTLVMYCAWRYNPNATSMPEWTKWLG